jgi:hypothetical protein
MYMVGGVWGVAMPFTTVISREDHEMGGGLSACRVFANLVV